MRRQLLSIAVLIGALALVALQAAWWYRGQRRGAETALHGLARCRGAATRIERYRRRPQIASDTEQVATVVTEIVETACRAGSIDPAKLIRVTPEQARRIGRSAYKDKPTVVLLRNVTLGHVARFLYEVTEADGRLKAHAINLSAANPADSADRWNAEITLTYLIFDPVEPQPGRTP